MDLETREWLQQRIDGRVAAGVGIAWLVAYQLAVSLEPVTHQPEPWYGVALGVGFMGLLATMSRAWSRSGAGDSCCRWPLPGSSPRCRWRVRCQVTTRS